MTSTAIQSIEDTGISSAVMGTIFVVDLAPRELIDKCKWKQKNSAEFDEYDCKFSTAGNSAPPLVWC